MTAYDEICALLDGIGERISRLEAALDRPGARVLQRVREASGDVAAGNVIQLADRRDGAARAAIALRSLCEKLAQPRYPTDSEDGA